MVVLGFIAFSGDGCGRSEGGCPGDGDDAKDNAEAVDFDFDASADVCFEASAEDLRSLGATMAEVIFLPKMRLFFETVLTRS